MEPESIKGDNEELASLAQSWFISYFMYARAYYRLLADYKRLKNEYAQRNSELKVIEEEKLLDQRLLKFKEQWTNPVKHTRDDISNEAIIELYNSIGNKPYQIAKVLQKRIGAEINYHTIISRLRVLKKNCIIK